MTRPLQINEMRPVSGKRWRIYQSRGDARLEHVTVPVAMGAANEPGGIGTSNDLCNRLFHVLKGLPVAARRECIAVFAVGLIRFGIPCAFAHSLDQLRRDAIALNREGVIGAALVNAIDEIQIGICLFRPARRLWKGWDGILPI